MNGAAPERTLRSSILAGILLATLAVSGFALALSGCVFDLDGLLPGQNHCERDLDCAAGSCDLERSICVSDTGQRIYLAFEVIPPSTALAPDPVPLRYGPFVVDSSGQAVLPIPDPIPFVGTVRWNGEPVSAELTLTRRDDLPGAGFRGSTRTFAEPTFVEGAPEPVDFALAIPPGGRYELLIEPTGEWRTRMPPQRHLFDAPEAGGISFDFLFQEEMILIEGELVDSAGEPLSGLWVRAIRPDDGSTLSSSMVTGSIEGASAGYFRIFMEEAAPYLLRVNAAVQQEDGALMPTVIVDPSVLFPPDGGLARILVPAIDRPVTYTGYVEAASGGSSARRGGAALTFRSRDVLDETTGLMGSFETTVTSSDGSEAPVGEFTARLLRGTYEVIVTPADQDLGVLREDMRIAPPAGREMLQGQIFALPRRSRLGVRVRSLGDAELPNAIVRGLARRIGLSDGSRPEAFFNRTGEALSGATGQADLPLDVGVYDLLVEPPEGSGLPPGYALDLSVRSNGLTLSRRFDLDAPRIFSGALLGAAGSSIDSEPVAGAEVRVLLLVGDEEEGFTRTLLLDTVQSDADGGFTVLLPTR